MPPSEDPILNETVPTRGVAKKLAKTMGCSGAHQMGDGWHPCESHEALLALINGGAKGYRAYMARSEGKRVRTSLIEEKTSVKSYVKKRHVLKPGGRTAASSISYL